MGIICCCFFGPRLLAAKTSNEAKLSSASGKRVTLGMVVYSYNLEPFYSDIWVWGISAGVSVLRV